MADYEAQELILYIENDRDLWTRRRPEFVKNALKKINAGKYDAAKAEKLWKYLADEAAKKYAKEFPGARFSVETRKRVARQLRDDFMAEVKAGEHEDMRIALMTKAQRKAAGMNGASGKSSKRAAPKKKTVVFM